MYPQGFYASTPRGFALLYPGGYGKVEKVKEEENLNRQIKQRTRLIPAFPDIGSLMRLVSALCAEISDEWETSNYRYMPAIKEL